MRCESILPQKVCSMIAVALLASMMILSIPVVVHAQPPLPPGVVRGDVYIAENHWGRFLDPYHFNWLVPGVPVGYGYGHACAK